MSHRRTYKVAILGATGLVGREMVKVLDERRFPISDLVLLASERSAGEKVNFGKRSIVVQVATPERFNEVDIVLASAGSEVAARLLPDAVERGCVCIDNSSAFRMQADVPLVVPEVNPEAVLDEDGIIANPNCSTIQLVMALKPLHDAARIRRVVVSTYQSVSGAGRKGIDELAQQTIALLNQKPLDIEVHAARIAFNAVPQIGDWGADDYTTEEIKLVAETQKILGLPELPVTATAVRVPVFAGHSESVHVEFESPLSADEARALLSASPGVEVIDEPRTGRYPMAMDCAERDEVFVGRIRPDRSVPHGLAMWIVADNLRKGAATNAVQIAWLLDQQWNAAQA